MHATFVHARNPFHPWKDRTVAPIRRRIKVATAVRRYAVDLSRPTVCLLNGRALVRAEWGRTTVRDGDVLAFVTLPQGGGGSNPLRIILMIALIAFAGWAVGPAGLFGAQGLTGLAAGLVKGAIIFGGMALVNMLMPPPKPNAPQAARDLAAPSPTYSLGAQGNQVRLGQPIPVIYGQHLVYPDFAAQPYAEFQGNEQFLYQLFCVGQGEYQVDALRIEDTAISNFQDVTYEVVPPQGTVTLFPSAVENSVEVSGQELQSSVTVGPYTVNAAGTTVNAIGIDVVCPSGLFYANDYGTLDGRAVVWSVEARPIDDNGTPLGAWAALGAGSESISAATTTPQRRSYRYNVSTGRYEVRLTRTDTKDTSARAGHVVHWVGLRGYRPGAQQYGNVTMLALRMRASNQLSELSSRRVNLTVTRKLPVWSTGGGWSAATATRSIAWAVADMCRNLDYGAGLPDSQIDLAGLETLAATWAGRGDELNVVVDSRMSFWEALTGAARAGRALPLRQGGVVRLVRDAAATVPVAMFSPRNIRRGTFKVEYLLATDETTDSAVAEYWDATVWAPRTVEAVLPGGTNTRPAKLRGLFGVTNRAQAWREAMFAAAQNRWRRKLISFATELEGFIPTYGDLISVSHDMPSWGQAGDIVAWDPATRTATLSEPVAFATGTHYIALRRRDGSFAGPYVATAGADAERVVLASAPDFAPYTGTAEERTHFVFGAGEAYRQRARVIALRPRGETVELLAVNEDDQVHSADGGSPPAPPGATVPPPPPTVPEIANALNVVQGGPPEAPDLALAWSPAPGAAFYLVEHAFSPPKDAPKSVSAIARADRTATVTLSAHGYAEGDAVEIAGAAQGAYNGFHTIFEVTANSFKFPVFGAPATPATGTITAKKVNASWTRVGEPVLSNFRLNVPPGENLVRVAPIGAARGRYVSWGGTVAGSSAVQPPPQLDSLAATGLRTSIILTWNQGGYAYADRTEVLRNTVNNSGGAQVIGSVRGPVGIYEDAVGAPNLTYYYWVRQVSRAGQQGTLSAVASATTGQLVSGDLGDGQIVASKVAANAIVAGKIAANALTVGDGVMQNAYVGTLQIAGQAVTIPVGGGFLGAINFPFSIVYGANDVVVDIAVASITSTGAPIVVSTSFAITLKYGDINFGHIEGAPVTFQLVLDGNVIYETPPTATYNGLSGWQPLYIDKAFSLLSQPGSGGRTYKLRARWQGACANYPGFTAYLQFSAGILLLLETKR